MGTDTKFLLSPFDRSRIKQREGSGKKMLDYVPAADVIDRLIQATGNCYDWAVLKVEYIPVAAGGKYGSWLVMGTLSLPDLGTRSGVGTAVALNEDSAKSAETDALKRAAVKFGVALELYYKDGGPAKRNVAEEFAARCVQYKYAGSKRLLCAHILNVDPAKQLTTADYGDALAFDRDTWIKAAMAATEAGK